MSSYDANWKRASLRSGTSSSSRSSKSSRSHKEDDGCCNCCQTKCGRCFRKNLLLFLLILSLAIGIAMGIGLRFVDPPLTLREQQYFRFPGDLLMRMLKCLIIPLIVSSLIAGLGGLDTRASGKMGLYAIVYYLSTTILAVMLGILLVMTIKPGEKIGKVANTGEQEPGNVVDSFLDLIRNMFPDNIVEASFRQTKTKQMPIYDNETNLLNDTGMINSTLCMDDQNLTICNYTEEVVIRHDPSTGKEDGMNVLGLVVFSVALGIVTSQLGEVGKPVYHFAHSLAEGTMKLVTAVIWYSPIGISFLVASEIIKMEDPMKELEALGLYIVTVVVGLFIHGFIFLPMIYFICVRKNPYKFLLGILQAMITALGTASSSATLPVTYRCLETNNNIDPRVTRFVLPVGATINMDGTALYEAVAAIFIAQSNGMNLNAANVVAISVTATLASIGAASVPQAGLVTMIIVLSVIGLPADEVTKILAIDWLLDRIRTMINVEGDAIGSGIVYHFTKDQLDAIDKEDATVESTSDDIGRQSTLPRDGDKYLQKYHEPNGGITNHRPNGGIGDYPSNGGIVDYPSHTGIGNPAYDNYDHDLPNTANNESVTTGF